MNDVGQLAVVFEPARRQACRSAVSVVAVEAFVNYAGEGLVSTSMDADIVASSSKLFHARFLCSLLQTFAERGQWQA
jgi:hypothetical protein